MVVRYTTQQHAQQAPSTVLLDVDRRCYFTVHIALYVLSRASNLFIVTPRARFLCIQIAEIVKTG